jgi:hypothetical protein
VEPHRPQTAGGVRREGQERQAMQVAVGHSSKIVTRRTSIRPTHGRSGATRTSKKWLNTTTKSATSGQ